jgi:hypothetical protein
MKTFIFGDIEGNETIYENTIKCISNNLDNNRFIFLGDIYNFENSTESIKMIENIISYFYQPQKVIFEHDEPVNVIRLFRSIWKSKNLKCCQTNYKQYWKSRPKNNLPNNSSDFKCLFIYGNKEVEFLYDIVNSKKVSKIVDENNEIKFSVLTKYLDTQEKNEKEITRIYSINELNVMYNYLSNCYNYYIENNILYTHCYFNNVKFDDIKVVVSGHNKGYGRFIDTRYENLIVYIVDLTFHNEQLNNYITCDDNYNFELFNDMLLPKGLSSVSFYM